ncbi:MAG TPA: hypothetical protein VII38_21970, partial [Polyangia bacterium]
MAPTHVEPPEEPEEGAGRQTARPKRMRRRDAQLERLEERLRSVRDALRAARQGDFSVRLPTDGGGGDLGM